MLRQFRDLYPQGSLVSELVNIDRGLYIVKVIVQNQAIVLGSGLAAADTIEKAEDKARERALMILNLDQATTQSSVAKSSSPKETVVASPAVSNQEVKQRDRVPTPTITTPSTPVINNHQVQAHPEPAQPPVADFEVDVSTIAPDSPSDTPTIAEAQTNIFDQPISSQPTENVAAETPETIEFDFNDIKHKIDLEMKRLNWTREQGRDYLLSTYGKRSRLHLTDPELLEFLAYLENLPN